MSVQRPYGVECKNPKCNNGIVLGDYLSRPTRAGDRVSFPVVKPGTVKCPQCGYEAEYDQADLRQFPENV